MKKPIPIGVSDFKKMIEHNYAYADKTLFIKELLDMRSEVYLFPRPRRFGKTLNISMLRYFFEKSKEDHRPLFQNLKIAQYPEYYEHQGKYPVIFLSLKNIKQANWEETFDKLKSVVREELDRHRYLLDSPYLDELEKKEFIELLNKTCSISLLEDSLKSLSKWLYRFHQKKVVILIDEYDAPVQEAYQANFYSQVISFLRNWMGAGLKDNDYLAFGVITGILRIAKESIFSDLNNVQVCSLLDESFSDKFGLTEQEVLLLLQNYQAVDKLSLLKAWYNGYLIGNQQIYNPWSILSCMQNRFKIKPYWINTGGTQLINRLLLSRSSQVREDIENLLLEKPVVKAINEAIIFEEVEKNINTIWSLFLFSGYLTLDKKQDPSPKRIDEYALKIPNQEVLFLFEKILQSWMEEQIADTEYKNLLTSLVSGNISSFEKALQLFVMDAVSFHDISGGNPEKGYHLFVLGLIASLKSEYHIRSNRESGFGRYDLMLIPKDPQKLGIILEFKKAKPHEDRDLSVIAQKALDQILEKQYAHEMVASGVTQTIAIGIAFEQKQLKMAYLLLDHSAT